MMIPLAIILNLAWYWSYLLLSTNCAIFISSFSSRASSSATLHSEWSCWRRRSPSLDTPATTSTPRWPRRTGTGCSMTSGRDSAATSSAQIFSPAASIFRCLSYIYWSIYRLCGCDWHQAIPLLTMIFLRRWTWWSTSTSQRWQRLIFTGSDEAAGWSKWNCNQEWEFSSTSQVRPSRCGDQPDHLRRQVRPAQDWAGARHRNQADTKGESTY